MFPPASCRTPADSQRIQAVVWSQAVDRLFLDFQVLTAGAPLRAELGSSQHFAVFNVL